MKNDNKKNTNYLNPKQSEALKNIESIVRKTLPRVKKREDALKNDLQCVIINNSNITGLILNDFNLKEIPNAIKNLNFLEILNLGGNKISGIKGLENLVNLKELNLMSNSISEIKGLENIIDLEVLGLSFNRITEIKGLENLRNLKTLDLMNNQISEIKGLQTLTNLEDLNLLDNSILEIKGLANQANLSVLMIGNNSIPKAILDDIEDIEVNCPFCNGIFRDLIRHVKTCNLVPDSKSILLEYPYLDPFWKSEVNILNPLKVVKYCVKKESEEKSKLKEIFKKSNCIELNSLKSNLNLDTNTFNNKIIDWALEFNFRIDGDYLITNTDNLSDFMDELDRHFLIWKDGEHEKTKKLE